ncbi:MAG: 16S rRNA (cytosine(1402)-N(4))-methyltransferase RsmH [Candidatus Pacebacteria bacterium]|jgi:16S rRNA (cytosine1402-N4)-methyltransferase|nr:16S rRNA (cytosine(1402)-N(4))-methyltransferase RsmH [Candidatus Paceibacterota bacterium]
MVNNSLHESVLKKEVIKYLSPKPNENFIDATFDGGGHSFEILKKTLPKGKILGIELDKELLEKTRKRLEQFEKRLVLVNDNFKNLKKIVDKTCPELNRRISGVLFDLGFSSWHIEKSERGFSFLRDELLDMRYEKRGITAMDIVNKWQKEDIEKILRIYGEERYSRKIAEKIIEERKKKPILKTTELVRIIEEVKPGKAKEKIHPATRTFQALRIKVNSELENIKKTLPQAVEILKPGGKIVIISFHSLEDRIVKNFLKGEKKVEILTKKSIKATSEEINKNPKSRSAKLRACIKK